MINKLNAKHIAFVEEYLKNGRNAAKAYGAVYKCDSRSQNARTQSSKLLKDVLIKNEIHRQEKEIEEESKLELMDVLFFLKNVFSSDVCDYVKPVTKTKFVKDADGNIVETEYTDTEYVDVDKLTDTERRIIKKIKKSDRGAIDIELYDKMDALNTICKLLGFLDKDSQDKVINAVIDTSFLSGLSTAELKKMLKDSK